MAIIKAFTKRQQTSWDKWVKGRPPVIQGLAQRFLPNRLYALAPHGERVTVHSYSEDGTLTVQITGEFNKTIFNRQVFGIKPEDLSECDLPDEDEELGEILQSQEEVDEFVKEKRAEMFGRNN